jgi:hypothetical protein
MPVMSATLVLLLLLLLLLLPVMLLLLLPVSPLSRHVPMPIMSATRPAG